MLIYLKVSIKWIISRKTQFTSFVTNRGKKKKNCNDQKAWKKANQFQRTASPQKALGSDCCHSMFFRMFMEQIILTLCKLFQSTEKDGTQSNLFINLAEH